MKELFGDSYGGMIRLISNMQKANNELSKQNAKDANRFSLESQLQSQDYNAREAAKNRDFQAGMSDTAHQREVADLKAAGLNPILSANNGAAVSSGSTASSGSVQGQQAALDLQAAGLYSQLYMNKVNNANQLKMTRENNNNALQLARISAAASMYGANASAAAARFGAIQAASASMYGADQLYNSSIYGYDKNSETSKWNTKANNAYKEWHTRFNKYYGNDVSSLGYRVEHDAKKENNKSSGRGKPAYYYD